jgi:hypothetical protein
MVLDAPETSSRSEGQTANVPETNNLDVVGLIVELLAVLHDVRNPQRRITWKILRALSV